MVQITPLAKALRALARMPSQVDGVFAGSSGETLQLTTHQDSQIVSQVQPEKRKDRGVRGQPKKPAMRALSRNGIRVGKGEPAVVGKSQRVVPDPVQSHAGSDAGPKATYSSLTLPLFRVLRIRGYASA